MGGPLAKAGAAGRRLAPGAMVAALIAVAAQFVADYHGAPAMLLALLLGMAFNFLSADARFAPGINFASRTALRFGVALLGMRVGYELISQLGAPVVLLVAANLCLTILFGLAAGRWFGQRADFSFLSAGAVAVCGVSAAIAIAAVLPRHQKLDEMLAFTIVGVTALSTAAMILYPPIVVWLGYDDHAAGVFLGATIHDVAQVVGAGFSVSQEAGEAATFVKLIRVAMLAPVVLAASLIIRAILRNQSGGGARPPLLPGFVAAFVVLAVINSLGWMPPALAAAAADVSRWILLAAVAGVGMNTSLREIVKVGWPATALLTAETAFMAVFMLAAFYFLNG